LRRLGAAIRGAERLEKSFGSRVWWNERHVGSVGPDEAEIAKVHSQMFTADNHGSSADDAPISIQDRNGIRGVGPRGRRFDTVVACVGQRGEEQIAFCEREVLVGNVSRQTGAGATWHMDYLL
jgi:hypothetical protein